MILKNTTGHYISGAGLVKETARTSQSEETYMPFELSHDRYSSRSDVSYTPNQNSENAVAGCEVFDNLLAERIDIPIKKYKIATSNLTNVLNDSDLQTFNQFAKNTFDKNIPIVDWPRARAQIGVPYNVKYPQSSFEESFLNHNYLKKRGLKSL